MVEVPDSLDDLGRVGVSFQLKSGFDQLRWFGRGQLENYPDRNRGAMVGTWESGVDPEPYLVPQEFGLRTDCRWFEFVNSSSGAVVRLDVLRPTSMHISATRFTAADLYAAGHETDLDATQDTRCAGRCCAPRRWDGELRTRRTRPLRDPDRTPHLQLPPVRQVATDKGQEADAIVGD